MVSRITVSAFLIHSFLSLFGQPLQFRFHTYPPTGDLESNIIYCINEDRMGFIWLGTNNGLYRFDGIDFKRYARSIFTANVDVNDILVDKHGDLWIGGVNGLWHMDRGTEQITSIWEEISLPPSIVTSLAAHRDGSIWVGTHEGLYQLDPVGHQLIAVYRADTMGLSSDDVFDLHVDREGSLWVATAAGGLNRLAPEASEFVSYQNDPLDRYSISSNVLRNLAETMDGKILVGTEEQGLNLLDPKTARFNRFNHDPKNSNSLSTTSAFTPLVDREGMIWVGTWALGVNRFDPTTRQWTRFTYDPDQDLGIPANTVTALFQSTSGDMWFGTHDAGLFRMNPREQLITRFRRNGATHTLSTNVIKSVHEARNGMLWIGTRNGGLHRYDPKRDEFTLFLESDGTRDGMARGTIWSLSEGRDTNILWLATSRGVGKMNTRNGAIRFYTPSDKDPEALVGRDVLKVLDDHLGTLWVGSWYGGLNKMNIETGKFEYYGHRKGDSTSIASNNINDIFIDRQRRLWIGTSCSLSLLDPTTKTFSNFPYNVLMIAEDSRGKLWLSTAEGLIRFDPVDRVGTPITVADGLTYNGVGSVLIDENDILWAGSDKGVDRWDLNTGEIRHIEQSDGLAGNDHTARAAHLGRSGKVYFGGQEGLSVVDPQTIEWRRPQPKLHLTNFRLANRTVIVGDTTVLPRNIESSDQVTLCHTDYVFAFEFAALDYQKPGRIQYSYLLEGFDNDWIQTDPDNPKAVFTNVPPGDYTFRVRAQSQDHQWQPVEATIELTIIPPWWQTTWARFLFMLGFLLLAYLILQWRISSIKRQRGELKKQVALRTAEVVAQKEEIERQASELRALNHQKNKLFSIVSHDLRSPLTTLRGITQLLDPEILDKEDLEHFKRDLGCRLERLTGMMVNLLDWSHSQLEGEVTRTESFDISELTKEMIEVHRDLAANKEIQLVDQVETGFIVQADPNQTRVVLRNLIGNAIKFTRPRQSIELHSIIDEDNAVTIKVKDEGVGMDPEELETILAADRKTSTEGTAGEMGSGLGLTLAKEFIEKNKGSLWVESEKGKGSSFYFTLPKAPGDQMD